MGGQEGFTHSSCLMCIYCETEPELWKTGQELLPNSMKKKKKDKFSFKHLKAMLYLLCSKNYALLWLELL